MQDDVETVVRSIAEITVDLDGDGIARILGAVLPLHYDWQHIRKAGHAAADTLSHLQDQANAG